MRLFLRLLVLFGGLMMSLPMAATEPALALRQRLTARAPRSAPVALGATSR